jgi:hypothetical protein
MLVQDRNDLLFRVVSVFLIAKYVSLSADGQQVIQIDVEGRFKNVL